MQDDGLDATVEVKNLILRQEKAHKAELEEREQFIFQLQESLS